jgi:hypothetical protein
LLAGCADQSELASVEEVWAWDGAPWEQVDGAGAHRVDVVPPTGFLVKCVSAAFTQYIQETHETGSIRVQIGVQPATGFDQPPRVPIGCVAC